MLTRYFHLANSHFTHSFDTVPNPDSDPPPHSPLAAGSNERRGIGGVGVARRRRQSQRLTCGGTGEAQEGRGGPSRAGRAGWRVCGQSVRGRRARVVGKGARWGLGRALAGLLPVRWAGGAGPTIGWTEGCPGREP